MKKFKVSFLAIAAVVTALFASAFTMPATSAGKTTDVWFIYNSGPENSQESFIIMEEQGDPGCNELDPVVCAVKLPASTVSGHTDQPDQTALSNLYSSTNSFTDEDENVRYKPE